MKNKLDFPTTEILIFFWGIFFFDALPTATYVNAKTAPSVQGQGFMAEVNPLCLLTHICATRAEAALQCM